MLDTVGVGGSAGADTDHEYGVECPPYYTQVPAHSLTDPAAPRGPARQEGE